MLDRKSVVGGTAHSLLIPAALTTSAHFWVSATMNAAKSSGEPIFGVASKFLKLACNSVDRRAS